MSRTLVCLLALGILAPASARAECSGEFPVNKMIDAMGAIDVTLTRGDLERSRTILDQVKEAMPCLRDAAHPNHLARFARQQAAAYFLDQDEDTMQQWAVLSAYAGSPPWPEYLPEGHAVRAAVAEAGAPMLGGPEGAHLYVPKDGAILVDGKLATEAKAPVEGVNFVQVVDAGGVVLQSFWQEGGVFPNSLLRADAAEIVPPAWYVPPDPALDPTKPVVSDPAVLEARAKAAAQAKAEAEAAAAKQAAEQLAMERKLAKLRKKEEKLAAKAAKRAEAEAIANPPPPPDVPVETRPTEWAAIDLGGVGAVLDQPDGLDDVRVQASCEDLLAIEPKAMMGRLSEADVKCLEVRLRNEARQTQKDRVSRVLMADAWAKKEPTRWDAAVYRHLTDIDKSDAELCYIYARFLTKQGPERTMDALRWSDAALLNATQWEGEAYQQRVYDLHRIRTVAAQAKWLQLEQRYLANEAHRELLDEAGEWRNTTKNLAREWVEFASKSSQDAEIAMQVCVSAAGFEEFCQVL